LGTPPSSRRAKCSPYQCALGSAVMNVESVDRPGRAAQARCRAFEAIVGRWGGVPHPSDVESHTRASRVRALAGRSSCDLRGRRGRWFGRRHVLGCDPSPMGKIIQRSGQISTRCMTYIPRRLSSCCASPSFSTRHKLEICPTRAIVVGSRSAPAINLARESIWSTVSSMWKRSRCARWGAAGSAKRAGEPAPSPALSQVQPLLSRSFC